LEISSKAPERASSMRYPEELVGVRDVDMVALIARQGTGVSAATER
jgi:hypothetical protein